MRGFNGDIQQGCELQYQVINPGHHSLKSRCELLKCWFLLTCTEHFWNLRMAKALTAIIKESSITDWLTTLTFFQSQPALFFQSLLLKSSHRNGKMCCLKPFAMEKTPYFITSFFDKLQFRLNGILFRHFTRWPYLCVDLAFHFQISKSRNNLDAGIRYSCNSVYWQSLYSCSGSSITFIPIDHIVNTGPLMTKLW